MVGLWRAPAYAQDGDPAAQARGHYESGVSLFEAGNKEQALVEFQLANELSPKKENLFMIAQCHYHLGLLKEARANYQEFLTHPSNGDLADIARLRIEAINRRPGIIVINSVPDQVQVRIEGEGRTITGDAPNEFRVPRGTYRVALNKANFKSQERDVTIDVADTKPLFFKLEPIPARLEIHTKPANATLYVRGNRTQNPYEQDVEPGSYEIYAEAGYYLPRRNTVSLTPGQHLKLDFPLTYVQRSGRPELIGFWIGIFSVGGGMAVLTQLNPDPKQASGYTLVALGALAGGLSAGVIASALVPDYIRDNQALFRIGGAWIGDVEGLSLGLALTQNLSGAFVGGMAGLGVGSLAGWWLEDRAPNYGRVTMVQSGAFLGAAAGVLAVPAVGYCLRCNNGTTTNTKRIAWGMLGGINTGLLVGLGLAYLPDQQVYGPSWQRVIAIDLATVAGGGIGALVQICRRSATKTCSTPEIGPEMARYTLAGGLVGLVTGWVLTMKYDKHEPTKQPASGVPMPSAIPVQTTDGKWALVPGLMSQGRF